MAANTGEIDAGDLAGYDEVCRLLYNAERRERELRNRFRLLLVAIENKAAELGTASTQPLGGGNTRTNRVKLSALSGGLNLAADLVRSYAPRERRKARRS